VVREFVVVYVLRRVVVVVVTVWGSEVGIDGERMSVVVLVVVDFRMLVFVIVFIVAGAADVAKGMVVLGVGRLRQEHAAWRRLVPKGCKLDGSV
jgi:hypothetical protein